MFTYIRGRQGLCAVILGAALLVKWTALIPIIGFILWDLWAKRDRPVILRAVNAMTLVIMPLLVYFLGYSIYLGSFSPAEFFGAQNAMVNYHGRILPEIIPFSSPVWSWLIIPQALPIFTKEIPGFTGEIILANNPVFLWPALLALVCFIFKWLREKSDPAGLVIVLVIVSYGAWFGSPRGCFLYYILPVIPLLALVLGDFLTRLEEDKSGQWAVAVYLAMVVVSLISYLPHIRVIPL